MSVRRVVLLPLVVLAVVGLGGCRGTEEVAPPPPATAVPGSSADPLAGIEREVDDVERGVSSDGDSDAGPAQGR